MRTISAYKAYGWHHGTVSVQPTGAFFTNKEAAEQWAGRSAYNRVEEVEIVIYDSIQEFDDLFPGTQPNLES